MKLQVAIDRRSLADTQTLVSQLDGNADIIEFGTSLIKDFGFNDVSKIAQSVKNSQVLYDIKTVDEGQYEFRSGFQYGADYLTVRGSASRSTLELCIGETDEAHKALIDLTDVAEEKVATIDDFESAVYLVHHNNDNGKTQVIDQMVEQFHVKHPLVQHIAVAGGINVETARRLKEQGIVETIIVGGAITHADDLVAATTKFNEIIH